jgi:hypothetical protein
MKRVISWLLFIGLSLMSMVLLLSLPPDAALGVLLGLVGVGGAAYFISQGALRLLWRGFVRWRQSIPQARAADARTDWQSPPRYQLVLEGALVLLAAFLATQHLLFTGEDVRIPGREIEWLTGHVEVARQAWLEYGDIPLWNPYYRNGEPLIDNAFSYLLNPISSLPVLTWGVTQGIKLTVTLYAMLAALGGWYLAYRLHWSLPTRLLLAAMLLGKGNMVQNIVYGYYQLGVQQAYFPWIIAGAFGALRDRDRTSVVLLGVMMALMFMVGNVWYILPMGMSVTVMAIIYCIAPAAARTALHGRFRAGLRWFNWRGWLRLAAAGAICLGVSAVYTPSVVANFDHIGSHDDEVEAGWVVKTPPVPLLYILPQIEASNWELQTYLPRWDSFGTGEPYLYYSHVMPWQFVLLIFIVLPPLYPYLHRPREAHWQLWLVGIILIVLMTTWGAGGTEFWKWLYANIRLLRGWRFVGRALAVGSFWVAMLVALRVEGLWRALGGQHTRRWRFLWQALSPGRWLRAGWQRNQRRMRLIARHALAGVVLGGLVIAGIAGASHTIKSWYISENPVVYDAYTETCLAGLRSQNTLAEMRVWQFGYDIMLPYIKYQIRSSTIEAEFLPLPDPNTLGEPWLQLWQELPEFAMPINEGEMQFMVDNGYSVWLKSPRSSDLLCIWRNSELAIPYAFTLRNARLNEFENWKAMRLVAYPEAYLRRFDTIVVEARGTHEGRVLTVKETAYPGWQVLVDGVPAQLDILGGYIAVQLPPAPEHIYRVEFAYRPPLVYAGGVVTIFSVVCLVLYLLRVDKIRIRRSAKHSAL